MRTKTFTQFTLLTLLFVGALGAHAQTIVSVMDGDWNDPNVWDPVGVPLIAESLTVLHEMTSDADIVVSENIDFFQINAGASVEGSGPDSWFIVDSDDFVNEGEIYFANFAMDAAQAENNGSIFIEGSFASDCDEMYNMAHIEGAVFSHSGSFWNEGGGTMEFEIFAIDDDLTNESGGLILADELICGDVWLNEIGGVIEAGNFTSSEAFVNDGDIYCVDWVHGDGVASGDGAICIEECFVNASDIEGNLDICDQTTSFCDVNAGTIAGTVTFCENSPCDGTVSVIEQTRDFSIYPNPTRGVIRINGIDGNAQVRVLNLLGELVILTNIGQNAVLDLSELPQGLYLVQIGETTKRVHLAKG